MLPSGLQLPDWGPDGLWPPPAEGCRGGGAVLPQSGAGNPWPCTGDPLMEPRPGVWDPARLGSEGPIPGPMEPQSDAGPGVLGQVKSGGAGGNYPGGGRGSRPTCVDM